MEAGTEALTHPFEREQPCQGLKLDHRPPRLPEQRTGKHRPAGQSCRHSRASARPRSLHTPHWLTLFTSRPLSRCDHVRMGGVVIVVFSDLVDSTALLARLGDDRMDRLRRAHVQDVRDAVEGAGRRLVKTLGDGAMASFESALGALPAGAEHRVRAMGARARRARAGIDARLLRTEDGAIIWRQCLSIRRRSA